MISMMERTRSESKDQTNGRANRTQSRSRVWLFRFVALLFGILPFLLLEGGLRLLGIGRDLSLIIPLRKTPGWYQLNPKFDEPFYGQVDLSGPEPRPFQLPKPRGTRRILVVGGSTVVGFPYPSELAFPRHIEVALRAQAGDDEVIEVLNAGITAMNSSTEVAVVEEGLKSNPDVIVVYTGHNEFYGPGGVASSVSWLSPLWFRTAAIWRRCYLAQNFRRLTKPRNSSRDLIESLPGNLHIEFNGETFRQGIARFEENLSAMAAQAGRAGVPIIFVSPVANEHDQPPIENLTWINSTAPAEAWRVKLAAAERELRWSDPAKGLEILEAIRLERPKDPVVVFLTAQAFELTEQHSQAIEQFRRAMDLDGCRFRAPSAFRETMELVAKHHSATGADYLDLHTAICRADLKGVPGRMHFLEHVHFTWVGNRIAGDEIAKRIWQRVWSRKWSENRTLDDASANEKMGVQDEDHLAAHALAMMIYQKQPFRDGMDAARLGKELIEDSFKVFRQLSTERQSLFEQQTPQDMSEDLLSALIRASLTSGHDELSEQWLKARVIRQPWNCKAADELADWLRAHGMADEADRRQKERAPSPCGQTP
jgi:hypothetical protein